MLRHSLIGLAVLALACQVTVGQERTQVAKPKRDPASPAVDLDLPPPYATPSATKFVKVIGWPEGKTPTAPEGFQVTALAREIESPRWIYVLPNGDVLVAQSRTLPKPDPPSDEPEKRKKQEKIKEGFKKSKTVTGSSPNQITLLRDEDGDGTPEVREVFLKGLNQPFGMTLVEDTLFVANTDALLAFPYKEGSTRLETKGRKIVDLPAGGYNNHWTRNVIASPDGSKLYISVGSASNVGEHGMEEEKMRACILEVHPDGSGLRIFASGLRNPVGMDWEPETGELWTAVNERDGLGDNLVPDYITSVREGAFYGWPYSYFGQHEDPRLKGKRPDLVAKAIVPDFPLGSHTASLGLVFYEGKTFPQKYHGGAFIGQRGSWNRSEFVGYRVAFVPFEGGQPAARNAEDFLTGFLVNDREAYGRPVGVAVASDGSLLVADEPGNTVWRVNAR